MSGTDRQESGYTVGEISALIAPLFGREPDELLDFVIVGIVPCPGSPEGHPVSLASGSDLFTAGVLADVVARILGSEVTR